MTKLKHGPNRRTPLDRRPVRHRDQPPQVDLVDVLGLPPLRAEESPVPRSRAQLADAALEAACPAGSASNRSAVSSRGLSVGAASERRASPASLQSPGPQR